MANDNPFKSLAEATEEVANRLRGAFGSTTDVKSSFSFKVRQKILSVLNAILSFFKDFALMAVLFLMCCVLVGIAVILVKTKLMPSTQDIFNILLMSGVGALLSMIYKFL